MSKTTSVNPIFNENNQAPAWLNELIKKSLAGVSHFFILWNNIYDYASYGGKYLPISLLLEKLGEHRDFIIRYDIANGLRLRKGDLQEFKRLAGINEEKSQTLAKLMDKPDLPRSPVEALRALQTFLNSTKRNLIILDFADLLAPQGQKGTFQQTDDRVVSVLLRTIATEQMYRNNSHLVFLLVSNIVDIDSSLRDAIGVEAINIRKPDIEERKGYLNQWNLENFAFGTAGLNLKQIEEIKKISDMSRENFNSRYVSTKKEEILSKEYAGIMKIIEPKRGFEHVGGLAHIKSEVTDTIEAMRKGNFKIVPMGMLFMGPPGTGKTIMAEALAKESGFNMVKLGSIKEMWVGSSERNMAKFIEGIISLNPVLVFIDEIDQIIGGRVEFSGDSGVTRTIFGKLLEVMSDTTLRGKIVWVGATNRPDLLDPAMKRPGRFDVKIPFLYPDSDERLEIIKGLALFYEFDLKINQQELSDFANKLENYNGSHIEFILTRAAKLAYKDNRGSLIFQDLESAYNDYIITDDAHIVKIYTLLALMETTLKSLLPQKYQDELEKLKKEFEGKDLKREIIGFQSSK